MSADDTPVIVHIHALISALTVNQFRLGGTLGVSALGIPTTGAAAHIHIHIYIVIVKHSDSCHNQLVSDTLHDCSCFLDWAGGLIDHTPGALSLETYIGQRITLLASPSMTYSPSGLACRELEIM